MIYELRNFRYVLWNVTNNKQHMTVKELNDLNDDITSLEKEIAKCPKNVPEDD